jgi:hypothetical protein
VQPDLQCITQPGGTGPVPDALVIGSRVGVKVSSTVELQSKLCRREPSHSLSPPFYGSGMISMPLIAGFWTLGVKVIFSLPSVMSTSTFSM